MNSVSNFDLAASYHVAFLHQFNARFMSHTCFTLHVHSRVSLVRCCLVLVCIGVVLLLGTLCWRLFQKQCKLTYAFPA